MEYVMLGYCVLLQFLHQANQIKISITINTKRTSVYQSKTQKSYLVIFILIVIVQVMMKTMYRKEFRNMNKVLRQVRNQESHQ
uniref:Putative secreted protein n=1 Tax=Xenopsylla cheopis TaxID=163159 RepID=A0A6M2DW58_XENCH